MADEYVKAYALVLRRHACLEYSRNVHCIDILCLGETLGGIGGPTTSWENAYLLHIFGVKLCVPAT